LVPPFSPITAPTSKILAVSVIDNGLCRASYEEVHCAVRTAHPGKEEIIHDA
jgi:hypothetical protein